MDFILCVRHSSNIPEITAPSQLFEKNSEESKFSRQFYFCQPLNWCLYNKYMALVVNFFGGPHTGKSTLAAGLYYELKLNGYNVELAREFAKDLVYEEGIDTLQNQFYVTGTQYHRQMQPFKKVDVVITDSPILLGIFFNRMNVSSWDNFVLDLFNQHDNYNVLLERNLENKFQTEGRIHDLEKSIEIDKDIISFLNKYDL